MSVKVELDELAARTRRYGFAYLVTVSDAGAAHVIAVTPRLTADGVVVDALGPALDRQRHGAPGGHPGVATDQAGGYSLIVDGTATVGDESVTVSPTRAVLHRPAPGADGTRVGNDCQPVAARPGLSPPGDSRARNRADLHDFACGNRQAPAAAVLGALGEAAALGLVEDHLAQAHRLPA